VRKEGGKKEGKKENLVYDKNGNENDERDKYNPIESNETKSNGIR